MDAQRKLLEELMNPLIGQTKSYRDPDVCAYHLVAFCPHELFVNTKLDLGPCRKKIHDDKLREQYQHSVDRGHMGFEVSFANFLTRLVEDMDRTIQKGKERISLTGPPGADEQNAAIIAEGEAEQEERVVFLEEQIKALTEQIEALGEKGEVDKAQELLGQVEGLKQNITSIRMTCGRKLTICEICSACLVVNETAQRMEAHLSGKQHTGYLKIRRWLETWKNSPLNIGSRHAEPGRRYRDDSSVHPRRDFDSGEKYRYAPYGSNEDNKRGRGTSNYDGRRNNNDRNRDRDRWRENRDHSSGGMSGFDKQRR